MKGKKVKYLVAAVALFCILSGNFLMADADIFGYYENRFFLLNHLDISWKNLNDKFSLGDYNRLRLKYQASPSKKVTVNVAVDFFFFSWVYDQSVGNLR